MGCDDSGEWPLVALGRLTSKIRSGATPKGGQSTYLPLRDGFVLVRSQNVFDHNFDTAGLANISDAQAAALHGAELEASDVLLNITGDGVTFGRACLVPQDVLPACVNQHVIFIRVDAARLDAGYLAAWLAMPETKSYIESFNAGGSRRAITKGHIKSFLVPLPPLQVQNEIGALAASLNSRIDLLRQSNATLEAIAQALFKSWFIDFDPVHAKVEGRAPEGMDAATAALFPREFEESELGLIPKGWQVATLSQHVDAERGLSYKGAGLTSADDGLPMHNLNSVLEGGGYKYAGIKYYNAAYKERHLVPAGDIIIANTEQGHHHRLIGFPAIVPRRFTNGIFSHHLYRVRAKKDSQVTRHWLYYCLMTPAVRDQIIGCSNGSTVNMLKPAGLQIPQIVVPPAKLCRAFDAIAKYLRTKIESGVDRAETLAQLRDTLLPHLVSGKLRLPVERDSIPRPLLSTQR